MAGQGKMRVWVVGAVFAGGVAGCAPKLDGAWQITAVCPPQSHFGAITIEAKAMVEERERDLFVGTITNNLGESGQFVGRLEGTKLRVQTAWDGQGPTESLLILDRQSGTFEGIDSNGCSLRVLRP
jgi:hypothetical protein